MSRLLSNPIVVYTMPKKEWFEQNPKVSAYLSPELNTRLKEFMSERGITRTSQALSSILEEYFGVTPGQPSQSTEERLKGLEASVTAIQSELVKIQKSRPTMVQGGSLPKTQSEPIVVQSKPLKSKDGLLTTGEAHQEAQRRGYSKSVGTFRRSLRGGGIPAELERIGLEANWNIRGQANPKDNSVKWLRFT
jgi:hypothetical protein